MHLFSDKNKNNLITKVISYHGSFAKTRIERIYALCNVTLSMLVLHIQLTQPERPQK